MQILKNLIGPKLRNKLSFIKGQNDLCALLNILDPFIFITKSTMIYHRVKLVIQ